MGCGKSTVITEFAKLGVHSFVADRAGAECYNDPSFLSQVRALLGNSVFHPDGTADKRLIASCVFSNPTLLNGLNALVHPRVISAFDSFCEQHSAEPYVLFESAILYDHGYERLMDSVICVYLSLDQRLERLQQRDRIPRQDLLQRILNQLPAEEMMQRADYVILNYEGNPRRRQVAYFDQILRQ